MIERYSEQLLRTILDAALDAMLLTNERGLIVDANRAACELLGLPAEQLAGRHFFEFSARSLDLQEGWTHFQREQRVRGEFAVRRSDGSVRETEYSATANVVPGTNLAVLRDVTDRKATEARSAAIVEAALDAIIGVGQDGRITDFNPAAEQLFGYSRGEIRGRSLTDTLIPPRMRDEHREALARSLSAGGAPLLGRRREVWGLARDGREIPLEMVVVRTGAGEPAAYTSFIRDLSQQRQAEEARRRSEQRFQRIVESAGAGVWTVGPDARTTFVNERMSVLFGYSAAEILQLSPIDLVDPPARAEVAARMAGWREQARLRYETRFRRKDGTAFWAAIETNTLQDASGNPDGVLALVTDISDRRAAAEAVTRLAAIADASPDGIVGSQEGVLTAWNRGAERIYGYTAVEAIGQPLTILFPPGVDRAAVAGLLQRASEGETLRDVETVRRRKDGSVVDVSLTLSSLTSATGAREICVFARDLTGQRKTQAALTASEERYRALFENSPIPMWLTDAATWRFLAVNNAAVAHYGYSRDEFLQLTRRDLWPEEDREARALSEARGEPVRPVSVRHRRKDGSVIDVESTAHLIELDGRPCVLGTAQDVTERRSLEEQLRQAQKMEAVGNLAGGIAHDFNNLLSVILCDSQSLIDSLPKDDPRAGEAAEIKRSSERAAELTRQLLAFSRRQVLQPRVIDVNQVLQGMGKMLPRLVGETIELAFLSPAPVGAVFADPTQVEQIILNLVVNARDAMPAGGRLTVETRDTVLDAAYAAAHVDVSPGRYTLLSVTDTGTGMDAATQARMFEPFFTTKKDLGTGLGLSTVFGIVKQSRGHIAVTSRPGAGTTMNIYLPHAPVKVPEETPAAPRPAARGTGTIALVEDEEQLRVLLRRILKRAGYDVIDAANGIEGLRLFKDHPGPIDLLLTDVMMPRMTGPQMVAELRPLRPGLRVLYMSGYTDGAITPQGELQANVKFLQKPVIPDTLLQKVREVIEQA